MKSVFFYISGHGFGHSIRQIEIINALHALAPGKTRIFVRTTAAPWLFTRTVRPPIVALPGETDTGVVQIDSLHLDERATIDVASVFYGTLPARVDAEAALLDRHDAQLVIADAPPLACAAADACGIPSVVCGNFTWDWIYRDYRDASPSAPQVIAQAQELYGHAEAGWRMPMHGGFETFETVIDLPFVARHSRGDLSVDDIRTTLDLPADARLALVSFGGYGVRQLPLEQLDCTDTWRVVVTGRGEEIAQLPRGVHGVSEDVMYERRLRYEDLVRAVDAVVTKPGYGIISDCLANGAAILYTSRGRFAEYDVLVRDLPRYVRAQFIAMDDLLEGRWKEGLEALSTATAPPERPGTDGADVAARMILDRLELT